MHERKEDEKPNLDEKPEAKQLEAKQEQLQQQQQPVPPSTLENKEPGEEEKKEEQEEQESNQQQSSHPENQDQGKPTTKKAETTKDEEKKSEYGNYQWIIDLFAERQEEHGQYLNKAQAELKAAKEVLENLKKAQEENLQGSELSDKDRHQQKLAEHEVRKAEEKVSLLRGDIGLFKEASNKIKAAYAEFKEHRDKKHDFFTSLKAVVTDEYLPPIDQSLKAAKTDSNLTYAWNHLKDHFESDKNEKGDLLKTLEECAKIARHGPQFETRPRSVSSHEPPEPKQTSTLIEQLAPTHACRDSTIPGPDPNNRDYPEPSVVVVTPNQGKTEELLESAKTFQQENQDKTQVRNGFGVKEVANGVQIKGDKNSVNEFVTQAKNLELTPVTPPPLHTEPRLST